MNKKEIAELKRLFHPDRCPVTRVCGCYVDGEKSIRTTLKEAFLSLPEEEMFKYFDIFKKTLSGTLGRNLLDMEFPLAAETRGGAQEYLMQLKASRLMDDALLDEFYHKVIETFLYPENYYIVLIHCAYDIPKKGTDGLEMFDASDDVYEFLLCSLCPVKLTKPGLCYIEDTNTIGERTRDWFVEPPAAGFLFPAFTNRNTDIHSLLYYSKNPDELNAGFARLLLGCEPPLCAGSQKDTFNTLVSETLSGDCTFETVKGIHTALNDLLAEHKDDPEPVLLDCGDVKQLLAQSGADDAALEHFDENFEQAFRIASSSAPGGSLQDPSEGTSTPEHHPNSPQAELYVSNVANTRKLEIRTPDIVISVKPDHADLIETRVIDGRLCFVIPADDSVEVNGIPVRTGVRADL